MVERCRRGGSRRPVAGLALATLLVACARDGRALEGRTPWTTSKVRGTPSPPSPYRAEVAFADLVFDFPVAMTSAPGTERFFVCELAGRVLSFVPEAGARQVDLALDLRRGRARPPSLYGLTFHPDFARNRRAFICYVAPDVAREEGTRVSEFRVSETEPPRFEPDSERVVITWLAGGHNGGCLKFGPDGQLYVATGDATAPSPPDRLRTGQDVSDLLSSILRLDVDRRDTGLGYAIPPDNPFVALAGARPEVWAYGLRNPWKMSFDRVTGDLWVGDVGWELWEMVYRVERGGNYGWSLVEGRQPVRDDCAPGPTPILLPVADHPHSEAASVTGGFVYRGARLPDLEGAYVYGDFESGKMWALWWSEGRVRAHRELADTTLRIVAFGESHEGELYFLDHEKAGRVHRLAPAVPKNASDAFPRRLSESGLLRSLTRHVPAPGVVSYGVNAPLFENGARAERLVALPGDSRIERRGRRGEEWRFPEGSVLARTVSLPATAARPSRRVETQILHFEEGQWRPYTYAWNAAQEDALLVPRDGAGGAPAAAPGWRFAARAECERCHNPQAGFVLGFVPAQLDRPVGTAGDAEPQLERLERLGLFDGRSVRGVTPMTRPEDERAPLALRARSYLHANCAHCHRPGGGGTSTIDLRAELRLDRMGVVGERPLQGDFGIAGAAVVVPGDPCRSVLYYRFAKLGSGHMPRLGAGSVDVAGLALLGDWIAALEAPSGAKAEVVVPRAADLDAERDVRLLARPAAPRPDEALAAVRRLARSPASALRLLRLIDRGGLRALALDGVVTLARAEGPAEVDDLFERFVPVAERVERLGASPAPASILALTGDAARGRALFFGDAGLACRACHRVAGAGGLVGPSLDGIARKYDRAALLDQILEPGRIVEPEHAAWAALLRTGDLRAGLLVRRDEHEVVLRDADGTDHRIPASLVVRLERQAESLMPRLLLQHLTAQGAADLVAYLASLE